MAPTFLLRLAIDFAAAGLLMLALAYYWLGDTVHELAGSAVFALAAIHNVFNRRWWGTVARTRREASGLIYAGINLVLLVVVGTVVVTSLMISRLVFAFLPLDGGFTARQIHTAAAYWLLIIVSLHIGFRWPVVMHAARTLFGITTSGRGRTIALQLLAAAMALYGVQSSAELGLGDKLLMQISMDLWDFNESIAGFFLRIASIVALYVWIAHTTRMLIQRIARRRHAT